jgi:hypothetical protein
MLIYVTLCHGLEISILSSLLAVKVHEHTLKSIETVTDRVVVIYSEDTLTRTDIGYCASINQKNFRG